MLGESELADLHLLLRFVTLLVSGNQVLLSLDVLEWSALIQVWFLLRRRFRLLLLIDSQALLGCPVPIFGLYRGLLDWRQLQFWLLILFLFLLPALYDPIKVLVGKREHLREEIVLVVVL